MSSRGDWNRVVAHVNGLAYSATLVVVDLVRWFAAAFSWQPEAAMERAELKHTAARQRPRTERLAELYAFRDGLLRDASGGGPYRTKSGRAVPD